MKKPLALVFVLAAVAACGTSNSSEGSPEETTITVFAAASLTDSFTELGEQFEAENPGVTVQFNFDGSSGLVTQLQEGAPADIFASADTSNMDKATGDDLVDGAPVDFATNTLEIATPPGNPAEVDELSDLASGDINVVVCAPEVPCGKAATQVESNAGIDIEPASEEQNVTDVLNKVSSGEADAGLVYVTDIARADGSVVGVPFEEAESVINEYPIALLNISANSDVAQDFIDFVTGPTGQQVLGDAGFGAP